MKEHSGWIGEYEVSIIRPSGIERMHVKNRITDAGLNLIRDALCGLVTDIQLKYIAFGDSSVQIQDDQTKLWNERYRIPFANQEATSTGQLKSTVFVPDTDALFHIREIGVFAGQQAGSGQDTGIMVSRILFDFDKSNVSEPVSLKFERYDTLRRL